jgi:hypothetical protein
MYCPSCGKPLIEGGSFCLYCGKPVPEAARSSSVTADVSASSSVPRKVEPIAPASTPVPHSIPLQVLPTAAVQESIVAPKVVQNTPSIFHPSTSRLLQQNAARRVPVAVIWALGVTAISICFVAVVLMLIQAIEQIFGFAILLLGATLLFGTLLAFRWGRITYTVSATFRQQLPVWLFLVLVAAVGLLFGILRNTNTSSSSLVGTWYRDTSQVAPMPTSTGERLVDLFEKSMKGWQCATADSLEFLSDGTVSASSSFFGSGAGRYEVVDGNRLKIESPNGSALWTFAVNGDSLTINGEAGCPDTNWYR